MTAGTHQLIGYDMIVDLILTVEDMNKSKSKIMNTTGKHLIGQMEVLEKIVNSISYKDKKMDVDRIARYCISHLQSNKAGIMF